MAEASLYASDIVAWSESQAAELRRLAATAPSHAIDWDNVIEEIECVGRSEWKAVESQFAHALAHVLESISDPTSPSINGWAAEVETALVEGRHDYRRSMARLIDIDAVWAFAIRRARAGLAPYGFSLPPGIPGKCPFTLVELIDETFTYETALRTLKQTISPAIPVADGDLP